MGDEELSKILSEMRVQNANILSGQGANTAILKEHGEKFDRIFKTLEKVTGNGDYKHGLLYKHDNLDEKFENHIRTCPGKDTAKIDATLKEVNDTLSTIKSIMQYKAGEASGKKEALAEQRSKMSFWQKCWDIFLEAPIRSIAFSILGLALIAVMTVAGCHKQIAIVKPILEHGQNAVDNGGGR